jgi:hypothetical protein
VAKQTHTLLLVAVAAVILYLVWRHRANAAALPATASAGAPPFVAADTGLSTAPQQGDAYATPGVDLTTTSPGPSAAGHGSLLKTGAKLATAPIVMPVKLGASIAKGAVHVIGNAFGAVGTFLGGSGPTLQTRVGDKARAWQWAGTNLPAWQAQALAHPPTSDDWQHLANWGTP